MHLIYAALSILLVGLFSMNMFRTMYHAQNSMVLNEVATELTGAGYDVLEHISTQAFDENTDESKKTPLTYPVITTSTQLTAAADFGGCTDLSISNPACDDLDDFDGVASVTVTVDGFEYEIAIAVQYVDPLNPDTPAVGKTFAKEVALTITNPYLLVGGQPLQVTLKRVFTYNRHITSP